MKKDSAGRKAGKRVSFLGSETCTNGKAQKVERVLRMAFGSPSWCLGHAPLPTRAVPSSTALWTRPEGRHSWSVSGPICQGSREL